MATSAFIAATNSTRCPKCCVHPGECCRTPSGRRAPQPHIERTAAYLKAIGEKEFRRRHSFKSVKLFKDKRDDDMDAAFDEVMKDLESGKLYREELALMKECGLDPDKPLKIGFSDGSSATVTPRKAIEHLKPRTTKKRNNYG